MVPKMFKPLKFDCISFVRLSGSENKIIVSGYGPMYIALMQNLTEKLTTGKDGRMNEWMVGLVVFG